MGVRRGAVLALTILGVYTLVYATWEDRMAARMVLSAGCFLVAWVYWRITEPPRRGE